MHERTLDDERCLVSAEVERLGDQRFSSWKTLQPGRWRFVSGRVTAVCLAIFAGGIAIAHGVIVASERGEFWAINAYFGFVVALVLSFPIIVIANAWLADRRRKATPLTSEAFPGWIAVRVSLRRSRGSSRGWLKIDGDRLRFQGERFDFDLGAEDFEAVTDLARQFETADGARLRTPTGLTSLAIQIHPIDLSTNGLEVSFRLRDDDRAKLEGWAVSKSASPSLLPPLRGGYAKESTLEGLMVITPLTLGLSALFASMPWTIGGPVADRNPFLLASIGGLFFTFPFLNDDSSSRSKKLSREVDRARVLLNR